MMWVMKGYKALFAYKPYLSDLNLLIENIQFASLVEA